MTLGYINVKIFIRLVELEKMICQKSAIGSVLSQPELHDNFIENFLDVEISLELFKK